MRSIRRGVRGQKVVLRLAWWRNISLRSKKGEKDKTETNSGVRSAEVKWGRNSQGCDWKGEKLIWQLFLLALLMFPLRTKHPQHPLHRLTSPNSPTPHFPTTQLQLPAPAEHKLTHSCYPTYATVRFVNPPTHTHMPCFHFPQVLLFWLFPPSSHHKTPPPTKKKERLPPTTTTRSRTLVKKHPPPQQCTLTRDETFSPQETSCSETLWLKCVFSRDMEKWGAGVGGGRGVWGDGGVVLELNGDHVGVASRPVNQKPTHVYGVSATAQERMKGHVGQLQRWWLMGSGGCVCTEMSVCACVVCYMGENHMVSLFSSLTTCRITAINRRVLLCGELCCSLRRGLKGVREFEKCNVFSAFWPSNLINRTFSKRYTWKRYGDMKHLNRALNRLEYLAFCT